MKITVIVARAQNGVIGNQGAIPWKLRSDLQHFKKKTLGHPIIMGRRTFELLPGILPDREHIVLSYNEDYIAKGAEVYDDFGKLITDLRIRGYEEVFVIGGGEIYISAMKVADEAIVTEVGATVEGDAFFSSANLVDFEEVSREPHQKGDGDQYNFDIVTYRRKGK